METFVPHSVVVGENGEIHYAYGQTGKYLEPAQGFPNLNVLNMAREGLRIELRSALYGATTKKKDMRCGGLKVKMNGGFQHVNLLIKPLSRPEMEGLYLVVFEDIVPPLREKARARKEPARKTDRKVEDLAQELAYTKERLQSTIEELETSKEELQSGDEELVRSTASSRRRSTSRPRPKATCGPCPSPIAWSASSKR